MAQLTRPVKQGQWSESALRVLRERYLRRLGGQVSEAPEDMCWRVASAIADAEATWGKTQEQVYEVASRFYDLMVDGYFQPNSPTLMNAGKDNGLQYSACFVLPVGDSMDEIFEAVKRAAIIHKSGGGTGFAFSRLRSKDSLVKSTGGKASGPVSFLRVFNGATEAVKQGGTRRGANMGILKVDHPDILEFIHCKLDGGIANFNISVTATDPFMQALEKDGEYELIDPHTGQPAGRLRAREVFDRIVDAAWHTGDPGLVFIDRVNRSAANPVPELETIEATNPCFTGDTLVWTIYGSRRFDELCGKVVPVLSRDGDGRMVFRLMRDIRLTRRAAPVLRVTVSARAPDGLAHQTLALAVNDRVVGSSSLGSDWQELPFLVPEEHLVRGKNELCLRFGLGLSIPEEPAVAALVEKIQLP